jgi:hypothetical protein
VLVCGLVSYGSGQEPVAGSCEQGNKTSGSIKGEEFLNQLNDCHLKKDSAPWSSLQCFTDFFSYDEYF